MSTTAVSSAATGLNKRIFQLKTNPLTGICEWVVIEEEEGEDSGKQTPPKALLDRTSYLDMLNDAYRNRAFRQAIDKTITKPCHVLDIGAGTGLLSLMAARAMGRNGSNGLVTAVESYLPMVKLMRKVIQANKVDGRIRVVNKRSDEMEIGLDIPYRADILVSEILDSELLGEGLIPTLQHAHDKLLMENPQTIPYRATIYGQLVECSYLWEMHDLFNREAKASDDIHLVPSEIANPLCVKRQQFALHCDALKDEIKLLSEPFKVFDFDFWRRPESFGENKLCIRATNDGIVHAVISWWLLQLDSEGTIFYSTGPKWIDCPDVNEVESSFSCSRDWCDHWKQSVWLNSNSGLSIVKGENVQLSAAHTETSIKYDLKTSNQTKEVENRVFCNRDCQILLSPEQNALYGDSSWRSLILTALGRSLHEESSPLCLAVDDSFFMAVAVAHLSRSPHVICLFPGLGERGSKYLQAVAVANNYSMDSIEFLKKRDLQLMLQEPEMRKINLLVAEPFYYGNESVLPWKNLRFWKERTALDSILSKDVVTVPHKGLLRACAMYLPDLWRSRCCLEEVEGFDHSCVNTTLGACGDLPATEDAPFLPVFIWQSGETKALSEKNTILELDFSKPMNPCSGRAKIQFKESGMCHGFVLWIDWVMDAEDYNILSTGPDKRHWKQAVKLLKKPVDVGACNFSSTEIEASFDPSDGELYIQHAFS